MKELLSPSGKYKLVVTSQETKPGCWNYTTGEVFAGDKSIVAVQRNYSSFPFLFVEGHPNGHDYLVCGADYQGQTVVELDTGKRLDFLPPEAEKGHAFCWAGHKFDSASQILVVGGCYWACPYEYRFYDFSDPMNGWPEIVLDEYVDEDNKEPEITGDIIKTFQTARDAEGDEKEGVIAAIKTYKREGNKLLLQEEWVSDEEKENRRLAQEAHDRYEAEMKHFKETDPLYLRYKELLKEWPNASKHCGIGVTHEKWCPDFKVQERRWCHRLHQRKMDGYTAEDYKGYTIDLEWATKTGPIKLHVLKDGKAHEDKFFYEHSVQSMEAAFAYAKELVQDELEAKGWQKANMQGLALALEEEPPLEKKEEDS